MCKVVRIGNCRGRLAIGVFTLISGVTVGVLPAVVPFVIISNRTLYSFRYWHQAEVASKHSQNLSK